jgi:hypothetical protein
VRSAPRDAMQRVVLELMVEVNRFVTDGTFRMCRYAPENTPSDEATARVDVGIRKNVSACRTAHSELITFFTSGVSALITEGIPRLFPMRPNTRVRCGDCGTQFNPLWIAPRDIAACCESCNVMFCTECYKIRVANMVAANDHNTLTIEAVAARPQLMQCARCVRP